MNEIVDENSNTLLHLAVITHQSNIVEKILSDEEEVEDRELGSRNSEGNTALHLAVITEQENIVKM
ncbi:MAG: ankyrin repeat domain-containing protein, partial [Flavobacteriales bacterium]